MRFPENSTVIVVHGAWADGSSWKEVILPLKKQGLQVVAAPLPLTSLDHTPLLSAPAKVVDIILEAKQAVCS